MSAPAEIQLRSCVTLEKGKPPAVQPYFGQDADRYLTPEYLRTGGECALVKAAPRSARVEDGDTILLWDGSNAGEVLYGRAGVLASTMCRASHTASFDRSYFFYALKLWEPYLKGQTSGSGIPHIDKEVFGNLAIIEFDLREQTKIAEILSTVDRAIEQTEALIAKQQRIKTGLMQDLLTRGIDEHGNLRSEQTHEFKDSPLGRIPVEWEVSPAASLCEEVIDCKNRTPPETADGHPVIRTPNVRKGEYVWTDQVFTDSFAYETWTARGRPKAGDVVITREAPFGEACIIPGELDAPCLGQRMMMYIPDLKQIRADYLVYAIYSHRVQQRLLELAGGSTVGHIRVDDIRTLSIPHPIKVNEQEKIVALLNGISLALKDTLKNQGKLCSLKRGLMQDLLTGNRRVTSLLESQREVADA